VREQGGGGRARLSQLRLACQNGVLGPVGRPTLLFFYKIIFQIDFKHSRALKTFLEIDLKIKVSQNEILYNFSLGCNPRIQMDFELHRKVNSRFEIKSIL
jgi:hypothetical protein